MNNNEHLFVTIYALRKTPASLSTALNTPTCLLCGSFLQSSVSLSLFAVCDHQMRAERESWEKKQQEVGQLASELRNVRVTTFFIRTFLFCSEKKQNSLCFLLVKRERLNLKIL